MADLRLFVHALRGAVNGLVSFLKELDDLGADLAFGAPDQEDGGGHEEAGFR